MATWGTSTAYGACTAIIVLRLACVRRDRAVWSCFAGEAIGIPPAAATGRAA